MKEEPPVIYAGECQKAQTWERLQPIFLQATSGAVESSTVYEQRVSYP